MTTIDNCQLGNCLHDHSHAYYIKLCTYLVGLRGSEDKNILNDALTIA